MTDPRTPPPAAIPLIDYLRQVIAALQHDHGLDEDEAASMAFDLKTLLCISDAHFKGYTPAATACAVVRAHIPVPSN